MAQQTINVGAAPNDGTGTPLRTAFQYTNSNFSELYTAVGPSGNNIVVPGTATISGDLTVRTTGLVVNSTGASISNSTPLSGVDSGLLVGTVGASKAVAISMFNCLARLRERDAVNNFAITTNINATGTLDDNTRSSWKIRIGSGNDNYVLQRAAIGSSTFQDLMAIDSGGVCVWSNGAGGTQMTLNSSGNLAFPTNKGIDFSANPNPAGMTSELLDDYEEGTWTPVVADATGGGNVGTCTINSAKYTKIGRVVSVECDISGITTTGMTAGNPFSIRGLPFASVNGANGNFYTFRVGRNVSTVSSSVYAFPGTPAVQFFLYTSNSATTDLRILVSDIVSTTSQIILSVTYFV